MLVGCDVRMFATGAGCWQAGWVLIEHRGSVPQVHPSAYVAPTAVLCGAVRIGPDARVLFGAVLTAEDGRISVGARSTRHSVPGTTDPQWSMYLRHQTCCPAPAP